MKTVRIKIFKFKELSEDSQQFAITEEIKRTALLFNSTPVYNEVTKRQAKEYVIKYKCDFLESGRLFIQ